MVKYHGVLKRVNHGIPYNYHAQYIKSMVYHSLPCNVMVYHVISPNTMIYHVILWCIFIRVDM